MPDPVGSLPVGVIYTGGTIGMTPTANGLAISGDAGGFERRLRAAIGNEGLAALPEFEMVEGLLKLIDSSNADPSDWLTLAQLVFTNRRLFSGFVLLTGTDTMAWTASALAMILSGLNIPVVLTGAQLPLGEPAGGRTCIDKRTDAVTNVEAALRFCDALANEAEPLRSGVFLSFDGLLLRGSCARKVHSSSRRAFDSPNLAPLGYLDSSSITLDRQQIFESELALAANDSTAERTVEARLAALLLCSDWNQPAVASCFILPGMSGLQLEASAWPGCSALILLSFGAGNVPSVAPDELVVEGDFTSALAALRRRGILILNTTQCSGGGVRADYETSAALLRLGVAQGGLVTPEAAHVKLHLITRLPQFYPRECLDQDIAGETAIVF